MGPVAVWNANTGVQTGDVKWKTEQEFDNTSTDSAGYQVQLMQSPQPGSHNLIPLSSASNKPCALCKVNNIRTATGLPTKSYYKCDACNVCLCRPQVRDCFLRYHNMMIHADQRHKMH